MEIDDTLLHLLPPQVHGFNLAQKLWGSFNVKDIHEVEFDEDAWDHLVLDARVKVCALLWANLCDTNSQVAVETYSRLGQSNRQPSRFD
jgi:hypothetical protein